MQSSSIALLAGVLFLVIAVVGGGFTIERVQVPPVPRWSRIASAVLGVVFVAGFFLSAQRASTPGLPSADPSATGTVQSTGTAGTEGTVGAPGTVGAEGTVGAPGAAELFGFAGPALTPDRIELSDLLGTSAHRPPSIGDSVMVSFTLRNRSDSPVTLHPFVAVRAPGDRHADSDDSAGWELPPDGTLPVQVALTVDRAGSWSFWPCYELDASACPSEWQARQVMVVK